MLADVNGCAETGEWTPRTNQRLLGLFTPRYAQNVTGNDRDTFCVFVSLCFCFNGNLGNAQRRFIFQLAQNQVSFKVRSDLLSSNECGVDFWVVAGQAREATECGVDAQYARIIINTPENPRLCLNLKVLWVDYSETYLMNSQLSTLRNVFLRKA